MKTFLILIAFLFSFYLSIAQSDKVKVERACIDYIEAFYEADTVKLIRSVKPELYKIGFEKGDTSYVYSKMTFDQALGFIRRYNARNMRMGKKDSPKAVLVLDVMKVTAVAKVTALWGTDYLLLSKRNGKWMIEEVIWEGN
jgi:hypothetical protein